MTALLLIISGFGSGITVGIASGTAGSFMIPCLTLCIGYSIHQAIGTSLVIDCAIGGVAGLIFLRAGKIDLRSGALLAGMGVIGALIGSQFTSAAPEGGLTLFIALFLIVIGVNFIINGVQKNIEYIQQRLSFTWINRHQTVSFLVIGFLVGGMSGFSGMGGGAIIALIFIFILGYDLHTAIGTALLMMCFIAGSGAIGHVINAEVIVPVALIAGSAAAVGAGSGALIANRINQDKLGRVIGIIVLISGILIIMNKII